jgi:hypothetical protein
MRKQQRVHGVEAALRESHRRFGGAPVPADFRRGVMAAVRAARQREALEFAPPATLRLWPAASLAAIAALLTVALAYVWYGSGDATAWMWVDDPLGVTTLVVHLL